MWQQDAAIPLCLTGKQGKWRKEKELLKPPDQKRIRIHAEQLLWIDTWLGEGAVTSILTIPIGVGVKRSYTNDYDFEYFKKNTWRY